MSTLNNSNEDPSNIVKSTREAIDVLYDLSVLLGTGLDRQTLALCVSMVEDGANPLALASVVQELRMEAEARSSKARPVESVQRVTD
ncbi:hypothetical protein CROQUDRAFT_47835 [Cronartium quercuum f. sp. fusiforme G11]|uniref:Mitotic-spindle organizing protein 1 n=1 Tax=Cronartium quercuum f. sp. fusiforme G11 TaxID=708437 RepID=A0A9P6NDQ0_9BASI|nr:hypothetical protein CROQUDRAFT_47835 [Cronartium quercuum f. sp. fusiforme G11]